MNKTKIGVIAGAAICIVIIALVISLLLKKEEAGDETQYVKEGFEQVKESVRDDIGKLKEGKYSNLIYHEFSLSLENVEGVCNIEILLDNSYKDRTFLENFAIMNEVTDKFFAEEIDKSFLYVEFTVPNDETGEDENVWIYYDDIENECNDGKYNKPEINWLFGNNTSAGGCFVQIMENLNNAWFSRGELGDIGPFHNNVKKVYRYLNCIRQSEDAELRLKDGSIMLSDMEAMVMDYINNNFPLPVSDDISLGIAGIDVFDNGDYEGVSVQIRRIYKGIPFEHCSWTASSEYIDYIDADKGMIAYAVSTYPDTIMSFGLLNGTVVETSEITELFSLETAFAILSESIGENSVYDVYGAELIYGACEILEDRSDEVNDIMIPKWKIITKNQNDDKYTIFYVDAVTGEITERFEPYYE